MWPHVALFMLVPAALAIFLPAIGSVGGLSGGLALATYGKAWYVQFAVHKIRKIRRTSRSPDEILAKIDRAGGGSKGGAFLGVLVVSALVLGVTAKLLQGAH
jgi:hypothetical protein